MRDDDSERTGGRLSTTGEWEKSASLRFGSHPMIQITYEELVSNPRAIFARLVAFLNAPSCEPRTSLRQQNPESLRELIRNYDELRETFAGSIWQSYFDDDLMHEARESNAASPESSP